jgi:hypothetical protein
MNWIPGIFRRRRLFDELSEEMRLHLDEHVEQLMQEGLSPQEAHRQARIAFGNQVVIEERSRKCGSGLPSSRSGPTCVWRSACCAVLPVSP